MAKHEYTSAQVLRFAGKGMKTPWLLTPTQVQAVCASCVTQARDKAKRRKAVRGGHKNEMWDNSLFDGEGSKPKKKAKRRAK